MNKVKRDYCSKGRHPKWKAWVAKYDMASVQWSWRGDYCIYCGGKVDESVATPAHTDYARMRGLRGGAQVPAEEYEAAQERSTARNNKRLALTDVIRRRGRYAAAPTK